MNLPNELLYEILLYVGDMHVYKILMKSDQTLNYMIRDPIAPWTQSLDLNVMTPLLWTQETKLREIYPLDTLVTLRYHPHQLNWVDLFSYLAEEIGGPHGLKYDLMYRLIDTVYEPEIYLNRSIGELKELYTEFRYKEDSLFLWEREMRLREQRERAGCIGPGNRPAACCTSSSAPHNEKAQ